MIAGKREVLCKWHVENLELKMKETSARHTNLNKTFKVAYISTIFLQPAKMFYAIRVNFK